ncbi:MAG: hypothetical protein AAFR59_04370 [Bacteroidota bacterium]
MPKKNLGLWGVLSLLLSHMGVAQVHNLEIYQNWWMAASDTVKQVDGFSFEEWTPPFVIDSLSEQALWISSPQITYVQIGVKVFQRSMTQRYERIIGGERTTFQHTYADTLSRKEMRLIIRKSPEPLAGEDPTFWGRWGSPLGWVSTGTGIILGLFYIRSQSR